MVTGMRGEFPVCHAFLLMIFGSLLLVPSMPAKADGIPDMLQLYEQQGAGNFSASEGALLWKKKVTAADGGMRSCTTCHGSDLTKQGKHAKTGKVIEHMAPSANPQRYTENKKIRKWFRRNCKWTWGRECTPQEKGNFLLYLQSL
jgi:hypothetical protein